jgi:hypothetical protein
LGLSILPEKASLKSASTPYPPSKVVFMSILSKLGLKLITDLFVSVFVLPYLYQNQCEIKQFFCFSSVDFSFCFLLLEEKSTKQNDASLRAVRQAKCKDIS